MADMNVTYGLDDSEFRRGMRQLEQASQQHGRAMESRMGMELGKIAKSFGVFYLAKTAIGSMKGAMEEAANSSEAYRAKWEKLGSSFRSAKGEWGKDLIDTFTVLEGWISKVVGGAEKFREVMVDAVSRGLGGDKGIRQAMKENEDAENARKQEEVVRRMERERAAGLAASDRSPHGRAAGLRAQEQIEHEDRAKEDAGLFNAHKINLEQFERLKFQEALRHEQVLYNIDQELKEKVDSIEAQKKAEADRAAREAAAAAARIAENKRRAEEERRAAADRNRAAKLGLGTALQEAKLGTLRAQGRTSEAQDLERALEVTRAMREIGTNKDLSVWDRLKGAFLMRGALFGRFAAEDAAAAGVAAGVSPDPMTGRFVRGPGGGSLAAGVGGADRGLIRQVFGSGSRGTDQRVKGLEDVIKGPVLAALRRIGDNTGSGAVFAS